MAGCTYQGKAYASCTITVAYNPATSQGTLTVTGQNKGDAQPSTLLTANVVVGGDGHVTPLGTYHASHWEKDHTSTKYGHYADTPYSKTLMGGNAFGPYQLHIKELETRGIYIHGSMGPTWLSTTRVSTLVSSSSHGCVRMANTDNIQLHDMMPNPQDNLIVIKTAAAK